MESILTSIKALLGPGADDDSFNHDIVTHINTVFSDLHQIGIGPEDGFRIEDESSKWSDYIPANDKNMESVKTYMYLRVKLVFDPPAGAAQLDAMQRQADRLEWRLNVHSETP